MNILMRFGDIRGACKLEGFLDWIEVESMYEGMQYGTAVDDPSAKPASQTQWQDTMLTKRIDRSSVRLRQACANGDVIESAELVLCTESDKPVVIMRYCFHNVTVTSVRLSASRATELMEEVSFGFESVEWVYTHVDPTTGEAAGSVTGRATRQR